MGTNRSVPHPEGPHSPESTREVAELLAECVRVLNHATLPADGRPGLGVPQDIYGLAGDLAQGAGGLTQTLAQLAGWLDRELDAGRLVEVPSGPHDGDAHVAVAAAQDALSVAAGHADTIGAALRRAQAALSGLVAADDAER